MIKSLSFFMSAAVIAGVVCGGPVRSEAAAAHLALRVTVDKTVFHKGNFPNMQVAVINQGAAPVTLVEPGDGSDVGWRTPCIGWSILPTSDPGLKHPRSIPALHVLRCGNVNTLKAQEIFDLAPGSTHLLPNGSFDEAWFQTVAKRPAGTYRIVFYYQNDPARRWSGIPLGQQDPDAIKRSQASTPCFLVSNELVITVKN